MKYRLESSCDEAYEQLRQLIEQDSETGLSCVRSDRKEKFGSDLLGKVHEQILKSSIVVADLTENSPNVYYEYGYASAHDRLPILIAKEGVNLPTDLVGKETLRYKGMPGDDAEFKNKLKSCLLDRLTSPLPEQRRMLASPHPFPACVIAAPNGPKHWWHPDEQHTFGDMQGITGILTAYGNLFGTRRLPELLHARKLSEKVFETPANIFCIGSPKVNKATDHFLPLIQKNLKPQWEMPDVGKGTDKRVIIKGDTLLESQLAEPLEDKPDKPDKPICDYGLVIRAPHPLDAQHLVLIAAGRHSIGTHAACVMVTNQKSIKALEDHLKTVGVNLRDSTQPFWAIVKGTLHRSEIVSVDAEIMKAGKYIQQTSP